MLKALTLAMIVMIGITASYGSEEALNVVGGGVGDQLAQASKLTYQGQKNLKEACIIWDRLRADPRLTLRDRLAIANGLWFNCGNEGKRSASQVYTLMLQLLNTRIQQQ
jgi:hypothetical protein